MCHRCQFIGMTLKIGTIYNKMMNFNANSISGNSWFNSRFDTSPNRLHRRLRLRILFHTQTHKHFGWAVSTHVRILLWFFITTRLTIFIIDRFGWLFGSFKLKICCLISFIFECARVRDVWWSCVVSHLRRIYVACVKKTYTSCWLFFFFQLIPPQSGQSTLRTQADKLSCHFPLNISHSEV